MNLDIKYFPINPKSNDIDDFMCAGKYVVFISKTGDIVKSFDNASDALDFLDDNANIINE